jgi:hypothetical protein
VDNCLELYDIQYTVDSAVYTSDDVTIIQAVGLKNTLSESVTIITGVDSDQQPLWLQTASQDRMTMMINHHPVRLILGPIRSPECAMAMRTVDAKSELEQAAVWIHYHDNHRQHHHDAVLDQQVTAMQTILLRRIGIDYYQKTMIDHDLQDRPLDESLLPGRHNGRAREDQERLAGLQLQLHDLMNKMHDVTLLDHDDQIISRMKLNDMIDALSDQLSVIQQLSGQYDDDSMAIRSWREDCTDLSHRFSQLSAMMNDLSKDQHTVRDGVEALSHIERWVTDLYTAIHHIGK